MILAAAVLGAVSVLVLIQILLLAGNKKWSLELRVRHGIIISKSVVGVSVTTSIVTALFLWFRHADYTIVQMGLQVLLLCAMAVLTVSDYRKQLIPNRFLLLMAGVWTVVIAVTMCIDLSVGMALGLNGILGAALGAVIFGICYFLSRRQLGAGDVKLAIVMGLYLPASCSICAYLIGTVACCLYSLVQILRKKLGWKDTVPLVPFLTFGVYVTLLFIK